MSVKWFTVGKLVNTQGIKGEVRIVPSTDFADVRFAAGSKLMLHHPEGAGSLQVEVEKSRPLKSMYVLKLKGYNNINEVERYKGWVLKVSEHDMVDLEDGEYYYHQILGCLVVTEDGEELGTITEILSPGANDVWVVEPPKGSKRKQILIPVIDECLLGVDVAAKKVTIRVMEGLI
ncbi:ribosome maturation factor RimM [Paenibacillus sp. GCM10023252]|uniref:ribosome maturation factor RimM n=1 Tax=Paenibacillus sp. GCM10023252 TaxID=3252649 RepID=UPI003613D2CE